MCITFFDWQPNATAVGAGYKLVLAANRDEDYARPSSRAAWWDAHPRVLGGTDLQPGRAPYGTWLAATKTGRVGVLTNYRQPPGLIRADAAGRGQLVTDFVTGAKTARACADAVAAAGGDFNGFNLLLIDVGTGEAVCVTNMEGKPVVTIAPGIHGLSNQTLDDPWPKVTAGKAKLASLLAPPTAAAASSAANHPASGSGLGVAPEQLAETLIVELMSDPTRHPDEALPRTGCGVELERNLSSTFVSWPDRGYGTRAQTVVLIDVHNRCTFVERAMDAPPAGWSRRSFSFQMAAE